MTKKIIVLIALVVLAAAAISASSALASGGGGETSSASAPGGDGENGGYPPEEPFVGCLNGTTVHQGDNISTVLLWIDDEDEIPIWLDPGLADLFRDQIRANGGVWIFVVVIDGEIATYPNSISEGACVLAVMFVPMPPRVAVCSPQPMLRADGEMRVYHDIWLEQWLDPESPYYGMPAAKFAKGDGPVHGTTCDNLPGYRATGQLVDGVGEQGGGNGQVYPEYVYTG